MTFSCDKPGWCCLSGSRSLICYYLGLSVEFLIGYYHLGKQNYFLVLLSFYIRPVFDLKFRIPIFWGLYSSSESPEMSQTSSVDPALFSWASSFLAWLDSTVGWSSFNLKEGKLSFNFWFFWLLWRSKTLLSSDQFSSPSRSLTSWFFAGFSSELSEASSKQFACSWQKVWSANTSSVIEVIPCLEGF